MHKFVGIGADFHHVVDEGQQTHKGEIRREERHEPELESDLVVVVKEAGVHILLVVGHHGLLFNLGLLRAFECPIIQVLHDPSSD